MIRTLFESDEWCAIGEDKFDTRVSQVQSVIPRQLQFVGLNPLKQGGKRCDENVSAFRNFLLELDFGSFEKQYSYIVEELSVPFSTCVFSGSKSLHFVIALESCLGSEERWRQMASLLLKLVPKADQANKNPSRFTRIGGGFRPDTAQVQKIVEERRRVNLEELEGWMRAQPNYWRMLEKLDSINRYVALKDTIKGKGGAVNGIITMSKTGKAFMKGEAFEGGRNKALFITTCDLVRSGLGEAEIRAKLIPIALRVGLALREANVTISSGIRKAAKELIK